MRYSTGSIVLVSASAAALWTLNGCTADGDRSPAGAGAGSSVAVAQDLETTKCPDDIASEVVGEVTCSYLTVPEDLSDRARMIEVMVGRITPP